MNKPEVRIIEPQFEETKPAETSEWEKQQLLAKYGWSSNQTITQPTYHNPDMDLPYEELCRREELKQEQLRNKQRKPTVNAYSIDPNSVRYSEDKYSGDGDLGFRVQIVSDMKL